MGVDEIALWAGITGVLLAWFSSADEGLDEPKKWARRLFLADRYSSRALLPTGWVHAYEKMFDNVFGSRHLSWRCYWIALRVSLATTLFASVIVLFSVDGGTGFASQFSPFTSINFWFFALAANATADYVSLLETRLLVRLMARTQSSMAQMLLLFADLVLTLAIFVLVLHIVKLALSPIYSAALAYFAELQAGGEKQYRMFVLYNFVIWVTQGILTVFANAREVVETVFGLEGPNLLLDWVLPGKGFSTDTNTEVFFVTTFVTSIWLWMYGTTILFVKVVANSRRLMGCMRTTFKWREKPMQALGLISAFLFTFAFWFWVALTHERGSGI